MFYQNQYQKKAHKEIEYIFRVLLPYNGLTVREEQIRLCHRMLDTLLEGSIGLCDAGVGIGKTYAYLVACVLMRKYAMLSGNRIGYDNRPVVISTSSVALQRAIIEEYIPYLSNILLENGIIHAPLRAIVRKGKEHFVCDNRLEQRLEAVRHKRKNESQREALFSLQQYYDMDEVHGLSGFDRRLVCVPKFCPRECPGRIECRYQRYLQEAKGTDIFIQICNHNYLLADASHRAKDYRPLLADYRALIVDEAHQLPEAARQMYGKTLGYDDMEEIGYFLEQEYQKKTSRQLKELYLELSEYIKKEFPIAPGKRCSFTVSAENMWALENARHQVGKIIRKLEGNVPRWILNRLEEAEEVLDSFSSQDKNYILYLRQDRNRLPVFCATSRKVPGLLEDTLWSQGFPAILTSGTLKAGHGFGRTRQVTGLNGTRKLREYVAESPFQYKKNCLLYLPKTIKKMRRGSREEAEMLAEHIHSLICSTFGHTLVLFTSYSLMGSVYQILRDKVPFPMLEVWRHSQDEIARFKTLENGVLFAAGSCWEGVDFPGDMVSSLIIVKLPFAVPDPISEAEREQYETLENYIEAIIVPDMQKKLRQGFGRAIRTEQDTCVVSILDYRAVAGGRYHEDVLCALPDCQMTDDIAEVEAFIRSRKGMEYYL